MIDVIGVTFKEKGRIYHFSLGENKVNKNDYVIVETEKGTQYGLASTEVIKLEEDKLRFPLKSVIRLATEADRIKNEGNVKDAQVALKKCRDLVLKHNLKMKIIDAIYTFNREQLVFHFLADSRIDFRVLAKDLASLYKTRIELRQVGIRDKAKDIGGLGHCGRELCCSKFLNDFDSVSISMAKNQNISLNPNKINGACGRLLCCLKYEDDNYRDCRKCLPEIGQRIETEKGFGRVTSVNVLNKSYTVDIPDVGVIEVKKGSCS